MPTPTGLPIYKPQDGRAVHSCDVCGAHVERQNEPKHTNFHRELTRIQLALVKAVDGAIQEMLPPF